MKSAEVLAKVDVGKSIEYVLVVLLFLLRGILGALKYCFLVGALSTDLKISVP